MTFGLSEFVIAVLSGLLLVQNAVHAKERSQFIKAFLSRDAYEFKDTTETTQSIEKLPGRVKKQVRKAQTGGDWQ